MTYPVASFSQDRDRCMFPSSKVWTDRMGQWRRLAGGSHGTIPRPRLGPGDHSHGPSGLWGDLGGPSHPPGAVEGEAEPSSRQQQGHGGQRPLPGLSPPPCCQLHLEEIKKVGMADPSPKTPAGGLRGLSTPIAPSSCPMCYWGAPQHPHSLLGARIGPSAAPRPASLMVRIVGSS